MTDPLSPTPLTERERRLVSDARELAPSNPDYPIPWDRYLLSRLVAIIDRLSPGVAEPPARLRLTERGREVRRLHRPTRRQCARIGLDWVDGNA